MTDAEMPSHDKPGTFTKAQRAAIQSLQKAFSRCREAGVIFWGVDNQILAMPAKVCQKDSHGYYKPLTEQERLFNEHGATVLSGAPYVDSGGW